MNEKCKECNELMDMDISLSGDEVTYYCNYCGETITREVKAQQSIKVKQYDREYDGGAGNQNYLSQL